MVPALQTCFNNYNESSTEAPESTTLGVSTTESTTLGASTSMPSAVLGVLSIFIAFFYSREF